MSDDAVLVLVVFAAIPLVLALYLLPAIVAFRRRHPNRWLILAVTVMLGSTGIGWAFAVVWAFGAAHRSEQAAGTQGGESGLNLFVNDARPIRTVDNFSGHAAAEVPLRPTLTDAVGQIERLAVLRAAGHITVAEFAVLKARVVR